MSHVRLFGEDIGHKSEYSRNQFYSCFFSFFHFFLHFFIFRNAQKRHFSIEIMIKCVSGQFFPGDSPIAEIITWFYFIWYSEAICCSSWYLGSSSPTRNHLGSTCLGIKFWVPEAIHSTPKLN